MPRFLIFLFAYFSFFSYAHSLEINGIKLEDSVQAANNSSVLKLNGAGLRTKVFFKVYVAALYLKEPQKDATVILSAQEPRRIDLHLLRDLSAEQLWNATEDGLKANASEAEWQQYQPSIDQLKKIYQQISGVKAGERIQIDFSPGQGTTITHNNTPQGRIIEDGFNRLLFSVWLGKKPVQEDLKASLLGKIS